MAIGRDAPIEPRLLAAVHLPPPTHGMAVISEAFVEILKEMAAERDMNVTVWRISADHRSRLMHHAERLERVGAAVVAIFRSRRSLHSLYVSADAGLGMAYTTILCVAARCCQIRAYVHHHSGSYLDANPELRMKVLCLFAGNSARHIVYGKPMADRFVKYYRRTNVDIIPVSFAVSRQTTEAGKSGRSDDWNKPSRSNPIRIGHLSNLSVAKGLVDVFKAADEVSRKGIKVKLVIAGPPASPSDNQCLQELLKGAQYEVDYLGPVYGLQREEFFKMIDVFLFPSRYRHESFGLVVGEALRREIPIVAFGNISLSRALVGDGGLVLEKSAEFASECAEWISDVFENEARWAMTLKGTRMFASRCEAAEEEAHRVADQMLSSA